MFTRSFKKKQFSWLYVLFDTEIDVSGSMATGAPTDLVVLELSDWTSGDTANVRNVSVEYKMGLTCAPNVTTFVVQQSCFHWAWQVLDNDEVPAILFDAFDINRAVKWGAQPMLVNETTVAGAAAPQGPMVYPFSGRFKQRFMKADEELRFICGLGTSLNNSLNSATLKGMARVSWEIP